MVSEHNSNDSETALNTNQATCTFLFSYTIASAEMRFIEVCTRDIYLRDDSGSNPILRGEISDCGSGSTVDLNQIFLEFSLSCEGCKDLETAEVSASKFGEQLGDILVTTLFKDKPYILPIEKLSITVGCVLNSMLAPYTVMPDSDKLHYNLSYCPIHKTAKENGLTRGVAMAYRIFIALCVNVAQNLTPDWVLLNPTEADIDNPLNEIVFSRVR
jgi:hypothetical protein